jgi:hypothetical protein
MDTMDSRNDGNAVPSRNGNDKEHVDLFGDPSMTPKELGLLKKLRDKKEDCQRLAVRVILDIPQGLFVFLSPSNRSRRKRTLRDAPPLSPYFTAMFFSFRGIPLTLRPTSCIKWLIHIHSLHWRLQYAGPPSPIVTGRTLHSDEIPDLPPTHSLHHTNTLSHPTKLTKRPTDSVDFPPRSPNESRLCDIFLPAG